VAPRSGEVIHLNGWYGEPSWTNTFTSATRIDVPLGSRHLLDVPLGSRHLLTAATRFDTFKNRRPLTLGQVAFFWNDISRAMVRSWAA
jgi:hypothetical protein